MEVEYGSIPLELDESDFSFSSRSTKLQENRRWSVLDKLDRRHYCQIRSCYDLYRILNCKCLLATAMLATFILLLTSIPSIFTESDLLPLDEKFDHIIVGGGVAGCIIAGKLVQRGRSVLLLGIHAPTPIFLLRNSPSLSPFYRFSCFFFFLFLFSIFLFSRSRNYPCRLVGCRKQIPANRWLGPVILLSRAPPLVLSASRAR